MFRNIILVILLLMVPSAIARPVSYPDGLTIMQMNNKDRHSVHMHYSPTANYSIGYKGEYWRENEWQFHGVQLNYLAKRWNMPAAQANMYLKGAIGAAYSDFGSFDGETEEAGFVEFAADWENRRFFTSYTNRLMHAGKIDRFFMQKARIGIAPYIGDFGDLHTWLMLEVEHQPEERDKYTITPLVRFFKGVHLAEFGVSDGGDALINYVIRF